jgi:hypothetical protein
MKEYLLKPTMTFTTVAPASGPGKPADRATDELVNALLPAAANVPAARGTNLAGAAPRSLPARQPLPTAVIDPARPLLKLGLDVHLDFIMAVVQQDHAQPKAPRKFTREELVEHVRQRVAEGFQVFCVQEQRSGYHVFIVYPTCCPVQNV